MAKINKYWGYVAIGALTAAAAGAVAALIAKKGSCKEDFDFEDDFDDFDLTDEKETAKEDQEPAEDFQSWGNIQANSLQQMTPKAKKLKKMLIQTILRSLPIKLLKLRLKMQKRKKMPMNPRILKRLWTLHLNLKNKRYRSQ